MEFMIRTALESDIPSIVDIDFEAFSPYGTAEEPEIFAKRLAAFPDGFVVAEAQGQIIGYGASERWDQEREPVMNEDPALTHRPQGKIFCVTGMAVRKFCRGQGVGFGLLARLSSIAKEKECEKILLETTHAQDFYLRHGFHIVREKVQWDVKLTIMELNLYP